MKRCSIAERHALVSGVDGQTLGIVQDNDRANLEGLELKPHRVDRFKLSKDPLFVEKVYDVVDLYLDPRESAVVLCVDEKLQVQALARTSPVLPMMPERRIHDYLRRGVTSLFAAFNIADGTVISSIHRRRWFGFITDELMSRGSHASVQALEADIRAGPGDGTKTPNYSSGPSQPNRSSSQSDDFTRISCAAH